MSSSKSSTTSNRHDSPGRSRRSPSPSTASSSSSTKKSTYDRKTNSNLESTIEESSSTIEVVSIKGRYERKTVEDGSSALLDRALGSLKNNPSTPSTPSNSSSTSKITTPLSESSKAQFEQQEDFISFDFDDSPNNSSNSKPRLDTPQRSSNGKRKSGKEWEEGGLDEGSRKVRKRERDRSTPWCDNPGVNWNKCDTPTAMLNAEAHAFITYISPTPIEHELRMWTVELIRRTIQSRWSDSDVQCFGSVGTGLYLPGGDIDLVVLCPSFPSPPLKPTSSLLHSLASLLLTSSLAEPSSLLVIAKARVPIVKFVTRYGGFSVDLSVNQQNGVDAAVRVRGMLENFAFRDENWVEPGSNKNKGKGKGREEDSEEDETQLVDHGVARSLVLLVKAFLNQRGMNEVFTGGLGSYSIICLVVSFLQLHPKIQSGEIHPAKNIGLLFQEFNEYYGKHFNYDITGITLRGKGGYYNKHDKGWWRAQQPYLLSIEDPNDPLNDVSGGSHNIIRVRQTLGGAADCLSATLYQRASEFAHLRNPLQPPLSAAALPNADWEAPNGLCQSLLGTIIGMSRDGIKSREENIRLFRDGILQDLLEKSSPISSGGGGGAALSSKKAMKKMRKQEKEEKQMERTVKRLEMRKEERELKVSKKEAKKVREASASGGFIVDVVGGSQDEVAKKLFTTSSSNNNVAEEESRYSISSSSKKNNTNTPTTSSKLNQEVLYIESDSDNSSNEDNEEEEEEDDDVILGGTGGDRLISKGGKNQITTSSSPKKQPSQQSRKQRRVSIGSSESSLESSEEEKVFRHLIQGNSNPSSSTATLPSIPIAASTSTSTPASKQEKKDKSEAKTKFWMDKGSVDTITLSSGEE